MFTLYGILLILRVFCLMWCRNTTIHICLLEICWEKNEPEKAQSMDSSLPRTSKRGRLSLLKSQSVYSKRYAPNTAFKKRSRMCLFSEYVHNSWRKSCADRRWKTPCRKTSKSSVSSLTVSPEMKTTFRAGAKSWTTTQMWNLCSSLTAATRYVVGTTTHFRSSNVAFKKTFCLQVCINRCLERGKNSGRTDDNRESLNKR